MRSLIVAIPLLLFATLLQSAVVNRLDTGEAKPILVLVLVLAWTMVSNRPGQGPLWALVGGLAMDIYSGGPFGSNTVALVAVSVPVALIEQRLWSSNLFFVLLTVGLGTAVFYLIYLLIVTIFGISLDWNFVLNDVIWPSAAANVLLSIPAFFLARWLNDLLFPAQVEV